MMSVDNSFEFESTQHPFHALRIVAAGSLDEHEQRSIPRWWLDTQTAEDPVGVALAAWESNIPGELPRTQRFLRDHVLDIKICRATLDSEGNTRPLLAYFFDGHGEYFDHGFGLAPLTDEDLPRFRAGIEPHMHAFYTRIHNGFFQDHPVGLMPVQRMLDVSDLDGTDEFELAECRVSGDDVEFLELPEDQRPRTDQLVGIVRKITDDGILLDVSDNAGRYWEMWDNSFELRTDRTLWESIDHWLIAMLGALDNY